MTQMHGQIEPAFRFRSYGEKGELTRQRTMSRFLWKLKMKKKLGRERRDRQEIDAIL